MSRESTRVHEAGHAIAARASGLGVIRIEVRPDGTGWTHHEACESLDDPRQAIARLRVSLAGPEAEALATGDFGYGHRPELLSPDEARAAEAARTLARLSGGDSSAILRAERSAIRALLHERWHEVAALSESLRLAGDLLEGDALAQSLAAARSGRAWQRRLASRSSTPADAGGWIVEPDGTLAPPWEARRMGTAG